jgi:hypothetical protein
MRTSTNSTRNTSSKSANNQQQKSFSNNLVILTGNLGKDAAFFGANDSAVSFRMATKSKFGEREYVEGHPVVAFRGRELESRRPASLCLPRTRACAERLFTSC